MNEKTHRRITICLAVLLAAALSVIAYGWIRSGDIRDRVERLQTQLLAAQESASIIIGQLGELSLDYIGIENELSNALVTVEHQQESISVLEYQITNATDASDIIGVSITDIDGFIERVENRNRPGTPQRDN